MRNEMTSTWADGLSNCKGKRELIKHLKGVKLTPLQIIYGICCRCSSGYDTGKGCSTTDCPGIQRNPYVKKSKPRSNA